MTATYSPAIPLGGILTLSGHGVRVSVERGYLAVEDGLGEERRKGRFSKIDPTLTRVVLIGTAGLVTLDAIQWLHEVGVPLIHLKRDGTLLFASGPSAAMSPALRRNQAGALDNGFGLWIGKQLVGAKIRGQRANLTSLPDGESSREVMEEACNGLERAPNLDALRNLEAVAARAYWRAWRAVPVYFTPRDRRRRPAYWGRFGTRVSPLGGFHPCRAVNPANAVLNYLYAILEAEARLAALAVGADPMLGFIHADRRNRDSLACDLMEPVRPLVERYLLDLLRDRQFAKEQFFECADGHCRVMPPLTHDLITTASRWGVAVLPVAQQLAGWLTETNPTQAKRPGDGSRSALSPLGGRDVSRRPRRGHRVVMRGHCARQPRREVT